jgi:hypothetical protein
MSDQIKFYGDWIFYGGILCSLIGGLWIYYLGRKYGVKNITVKHYVLVITTCLFLGVLLPFWLVPGHLAVKVFGTLLMVSFGIARYIATTNVQESNSAAKNGEDYSPPPIRKKIFWASVAIAVIAFLLLDRFGE